MRAGGQSAWQNGGCVAVRVIVLSCIGCSSDFSPPPTQAAGVATAAWPHATNAVAAALTWKVPGPEPEASPLPTGTICTLMLCPGVILFETKPFIKALVGSPSWARTPGWDQRAARLLYEMLWGTLPS